MINKIQIGSIWVNKKQPHLLVEVTDIDNESVDFIILGSINLEIKGLKISLTDFKKYYILQFWYKHFPKNPEEVKTWKPYINLHALDIHVLAVANSRIEGSWCAYIKSVPGIKHREEYTQVLNYGSKLREEVALVLFPEFEGVPYAT